MTQPEGEDLSLAEKLRRKATTAKAVRDDASKIVEESEHRAFEEETKRLTQHFISKIPEITEKAASDGKDSARVFYMTDRTYPEDTPIMPV